MPFEERRLCVLNASNRYSDHPDELYSEERKVAEFFAHAAGDSFDLFGEGWDYTINLNYRGAAPHQDERSPPLSFQLLLRDRARLERVRHREDFRQLRGWLRARLLGRA